jgi:hypothetical protein
LRTKWVLVLVAIGVFPWLILCAGNFAHPSAQASASLDIPGDSGSLPQANGVTYGGAVLSPIISARQAINAAEQEYGLTDAQIDPVARATAVLVSVGTLPTEQNMRVWVVTADVPVALRGGPRTPAGTLSKLCILIDALTGKYVMAYGAGPLHSGP